MSREDVCETLAFAAFTAFFVTLAVVAFLALVLGLAYGVTYVIAAAWHAAAS